MAAMCGWSSARHNGMVVHWERAVRHVVRYKGLASLVGGSGVRRRLVLLGDTMPCVYHLLSTNSCMSTRFNLRLSTSVCCSFHLCPDWTWHWQACGCAVHTSIHLSKQVSHMTTSTCWDIQSRTMMDWQLECSPRRLFPLHMWLTTLIGHLWSPSLKGYKSLFSNMVMRAQFVACSLRAIGPISPGKQALNICTPCPQRSQV